MPYLPAPPTTLNPLTEDERNLVRDYAGYPVDAAVPFLGLVSQSASLTLDQIIANLTDSQCDNLRNNYMAPLAQLKGDIVLVRQNLVAAKADVYTYNLQELTQRTTLYSQIRRDMCFSLGVSPGPGTVPLVPAVLIA